MFIGDYEKDIAWSMNGIKGCKRFLERVIKLNDKVVSIDEYSPKLINLIHKTIKKVTDDILTMNYNTAVSSLMILANSYDDEVTITKKDYELLLTLLNPIAPHLTEELNEILGNTPICLGNWPTYEEQYLTEDIKEIGVQFNGKLIGSINIRVDADEEEALNIAGSYAKIANYLKNSRIDKIIYVPGRILNIVGKKTNI